MSTHILLTKTLLDWLPPRLFLRIFLWFWFATITLIAAYSLAAISIQPDLSLGAWGLASRSLLPYLGRQAADSFEKCGTPCLNAVLREIAREGKLKAYLLDSTGRSLNGEPPPDKSFWIAMITDEKDSSGTATSRLANTKSYISIQSTSGKSYTFVMTLSWRPFQRIVRAGSDGLWLPFLATLPASGLVCFLLAQHIARPVVALREVTRRFASGDLNARFNTTDASGYKDEFGDLGREFNAMAARVQSLLSTQKQMLGDISHEFGGPLSRLRLAVEMVSKQLGTDASVYLARMERETDRLSQLSCEALNLLRASDPISSDFSESIDLAFLLQDIVADAAYEGSPRGVIVRGLWGESQIQIMGNREQLRRALENVVRNAVKYTPTNSEVLVEAYPTIDKSSVRIRVMDQGSGVIDEHLERIFEPFFRSCFARGRGSGGFGLGLAIASAAVRSHGGSIAASNRDQGGLSIEIHLPLTTHTQFPD